MFSPAETEYLSASDACFARSRLALAGIQTSRQFAAMLRDGGWIDAHLALVTGPLWRDCHATPHSPTLTYLSRALILAQVNWTLLLHAVLPVEPHRPMTSPCSTCSPTSTRRSLMWAYRVKLPFPWSIST